MTIVPKRSSKICRSPPAYPDETVKRRESTELSNLCFDQVVNRRSYKMVQIRRPTSKNPKQHLQPKYQVVFI
ncbi:hypothetical protein TNCV_3335541 [Trichonephila clavipes]|nr:hypothetical protein TNCV_3335541 [Trichonephila clavipes]